MESIYTILKTFASRFRLHRLGLQGLKLNQLMGIVPKGKQLYMDDIDTENLIKKVNFLGFV